MPNEVSFIHRTSFAPNYNNTEKLVNLTPVRFASFFVSSDSKVTFSHSITLNVSQFKHKRYEQDKYYRYSSIEREGAGVCHEGGTHQRQTDPFCRSTSSWSARQPQRAIS